MEQNIFMFKYNSHFKKVSDAAILKNFMLLWFLMTFNILETNIISHHDDDKSRIGRIWYGG